jgi:hypothetical protein
VNAQTIQPALTSNDIIASDGSQLTSASKESLITELINSNLVSALIGFVSALLVFGLAERKQQKRKASEENDKYLVSLQSTENEIEFYKGKLEFLSGQLAEALNCIQNNNLNFATPSYSFYPDFLEKSKSDLSGFFRNSHLVHEVGHCHFELCHIVERLNWLKMLGRHEIFANRNNIAGMKDLVDSNIPVFAKTVALTQTEMEAVRAKNSLKSLM